MKEKIEDIKALVKNDRRIWFVGAFVLAALFVWSLTNQPTRKRHIPDDKPSPQGMGPTEQYGDLIQAFKNDIDTAKRDQAQMNDQMVRTEASLKEHKERVSGIFETIVDKFENLQREVDSLAAALKQQQEAPSPDQAKVLEGPDSVESIGFDKPNVAPPPPEPKPLRVSVIAPGDSVDVELLTGVNAPVDGTPYPVVFKLAGPIGGPDGSSLELGEARLIAAAQGSESDSRALFRLSSLSLRHSSGRRAVVKVDGWVVGEDGVRGMTGRLIDKLGRLILATAGVSFAAALGQRVGGGNTYYNSNRGNNGLRLNPNDVNLATASALTDASNRLGQILLNRYESLVPVVEVLSGREAVAIFSQSAEIGVLEEDQDYGDGVYAASFND